MSKTNASSNLSVADIISFVSILLLGVLVFFGMNFMTLGDKVPSIVVAVLIVILMTVFVFLAAYAKAQDFNQSSWKKVALAMLILYGLSLVPCYFFTAKFFDIQFDKDSVMSRVNADVDDINKLFTDYNRKAEARTNAYQIEIEALMSSSEGRTRLAKMLDIKNPSDLTKEFVNEEVQAFSRSLKGADFKVLEADKDLLLSNVGNNFNNWNIMLIPQYAYELGSSKPKFAEELERIYTDKNNKLEKNVPEFESSLYLNESGIITKFKSANSFSIMGIIVVVILGALGLSKYLLGKRSMVVQMKKGDASEITENGGIII